jgi:hypothetical protein
VSETVFDVFVASPDDAVNGREVVETGIKAWNTKRRYAENVRFRNRYFRRHAVPILGRGDGQSVTNAQLVDNAHIVLGVFHRRLGTQTARAPSGSAEEIERALSLNKIIHVYFSEQSPGATGGGLEPRLLEFRKNVEGLGLVGTYESSVSLRKKVMKALDHDVSELRLRDSSHGAWLQPVQARVSGSSSILVGYDRQSGRIEVRNAGRHVIEDIAVAMSRNADVSVGQRGKITPQIFGGMKRGFLHPFTSIHFSLNKSIFKHMNYVPFEVSYEDHGEVQRLEYVLAALQND